MLVSVIDICHISVLGIVRIALAASVLSVAVLASYNFVFHIFVFLRTVCDESLSFPQIFFPADLISFETWVFLQTGGSVLS